MSLWVDKYRPTSLSKLDYHKELAAHLKKLVSHLLLSCGVQSQVECLREHLIVLEACLQDALFRFFFVVKFKGFTSVISLLLLF